MVWLKNDKLRKLETQLDVGRGAKVGFSQTFLRRRKKF